jgi:hypothetical protein
MDDQNQEQAVLSNSENIQVPRRRRLRRVGCSVLLVIWFTFLLLPCFLLVLATQQEIIISQGELPGQEIRIRLITDIDQRGIGFWTTSTTTGTEGDICLVTNVRYILWEGQGDPAQYCQCFSREAENGAWIPSENACPE